ncbi:hypothetical protein [Promicromonospora iranensis]|uniref:hypothetical protein n=1 Tax=Promicromonospora iranensis TaxID=1105144 RepID=UPI0023A9CE3F|nr:hypothetical protein [Promicromonospora iranensis]
MAITSVVALVTARLSHTWQREARHDDRRQARADLRRTSYVDFLTQTQKVIDDATAWMESTGADLQPTERLAAFASDLGACTHERDSRERNMKLVAGPEVRAAMEDYDAWFRRALKETILQQRPGFKDSDDHERALIEVMINELDREFEVKDESPPPRWRFWGSPRGLRGHEADP